MADQEIARLIIRISAELSDLKTQFESVKKSTKDLADTTKTNIGYIKKDLDALRTGWIAISAAGYAAFRVMSQAFRWAELSAQADQTREAFVSVANAAGISASKLLSALQNATQGTVDDFTLMQQAMVLMTEHIPFDMIVKLAEASIPAAKRMGVDVSEAFKIVATSVENMNTRSLKLSMGLADQEVIFQNYAITVNKGASELTEYEKRMAIVLAVSEKMVVINAQMGKGLSDHAKTIQIIKKEWGDIGKILGEVVWASISLITGAFYALDAAIFVSIGAITKLLGRIAYIGSLLPKGLGGELFLNIAKGVDEVSETTLGMAKEMFEKSKEYGEGIGKIFGKIVFPSKALIGEAPGLVPPPPAGVKYDPKTELAKLKMQMDDRIAIIRKAIAEEQALSKLGLAENERDRELGLADEEKYLKNKQDIEARDLEYMTEKLTEERTLTEDFYARMASVAGLTTQEKTGIRREGNQKIIELDIKLYQTSLALQEKGVISEIETEKLRQKIILDLDKAITDMKITNRELEMAKTEDLYQRGLLRIKDYYDAVKKYDQETTDAIVRSLQLRLITEKGLNREERLKIEAEIQKNLNDLAKKNIETTRESDKAIQNITQSTEDWSIRINELTGNWNGYWEAQKKSLEIQRQIAIENARNDTDLKKLINTYYDLRDAEAEAYKNLDIFRLSQIGMRESITNTYKELGDTLKNLIPNTVNIATDAFRGFFDNLIDGTMSARDAIRQLPMDFSRAVLKMMVDLGMLILRMYLFRALASFIPGLGGGGMVGTEFGPPSYALAGQTGGIVVGPSGKDNIPARLTAGEYVIREKASTYYGPGFMSAINNMLLPRPSFSFALGGQVPIVRNGNNERPINIFNIVDRSEMNRWAASPDGQDAVINVIASRASSVKKMLR